MEGLGARLGRSSSRYGPAAVFSGPVRRWKKTWVPLSSSSHSNHPSSNSRASHLLLYKWTPLSQNNGGKDDSSAATEERPRKKFRYVPVFVIEEQKKEASEQVDDEGKPGDNAMKGQEPVVSKDNNIDGKPNVNNGPADETQALVSGKDQVGAPQVNETNLDLSLGLKAHDGDPSTRKVKAET